MALAEFWATWVRYKMVPVRYKIVTFRYKIVTVRCKIVTVRVFLIGGATISGENSKRTT